MSKQKRVELLIIDPQKDFCDPSGSLYVPGADKDCERLADFITRHSDKIDDIHVTLDSHHLLDVAHPMFWIDTAGNNPNPFTIITHSDVKSGVWTPVVPAWRSRMLDYTKSLEDNQRYALCIWPPHCLIGTPGHNVESKVMDALLAWERNVSMVDFVTKGSNIWTEHYSALRADVPDPQDPSTLLNDKLISVLQRADIVIISGQALSHCVANSVRDIAETFGDDNIQKIYLLQDTTSSVPGFEQLGANFISELSARGMKLVNSTDFLN